MSVPRWAAPLQVQALPCLGGMISFVRRREPLEAVGVMDDTAARQRVLRLQNYATQVTGLLEEGLAMQHCFTQLRAYVSGAAAHCMRVRLAYDRAWASYGRVVETVVERWLGGPLNTAGKCLRFLPFRLGGWGVGSANGSADAASLAS